MPLQSHQRQLQLAMYRLAQLSLTKMESLLVRVPMNEKPITIQLHTLRLSQFVTLPAGCKIPGSMVALSL
jgi:hypothetical protein